MTVSVGRLDGSLPCSTYGYGITIRHVHASTVQRPRLRRNLRGGLGDRLAQQQRWRLPDPDLTTALKLALDATSHRDD